MLTASLNWGEAVSALMVLASKRLKIALSFDQACSIGLSSGE
jgi:hypothetical protein